MQKTILEAKGLYTDPNLLSKVPEGALVEADNIVIDRDGVIESRRGFAQYGNEFGIGTDRAKQLLVYKNRLLVHYGDTLLFNSVPHNNTEDSNFLAFDGSYSETEFGRRIRGIESNRNFYFTTDSGIKKISAKSASDFTTSPGFIINAGGVKALDVTGQLNTEGVGFLPPNSKVAYRVVWGYTDANDNLILGTVSSRLVMTNFSDVNANVDLEFVIPETVDSNYFYQIYRTAVFTAVGNLTLDLIDPGDEMQLVIEEFPDAAELAASLVQITDITPEDFRQGGTFLYTNPNSGQGIGQNNEPPPLAKDLTMYQNTVFYANTVSKANKTIALLSTSGLVSGVSSITIDNGITPAQIYTFVGEKEITQYDFTSYSGTIPADLDGKYFLMNSASNIRKYYVWYDNTKTTQTLDFTSYVGVIPTDLDGKYVVIYTNTDRTYYVWYDATGTTPDPGNEPNNTDLVGFIGIRVDISSGVTTTAELAEETANTLVAENVFNDYDIDYTVINTFLVVETESFDDIDKLTIQNIQRGFSYELVTPTNSDPANDPGTYTDAVGRIGMRVNVSRGVISTAELADATAAAILEQDLASDFEVNYTPATTLFSITNTNNGNTDDAIDSGINGIGNGFAITVKQQGDGEDSALNRVLLSDAATPAQRIDETARSLVNIINKNQDESVYAFYTSGLNDIPGQFVLEVRDVGINQFTITANDATVGALFNPQLPPAVGALSVEGEIETKPNRIFYSKLQQPEAVPLLNFIDVGPEDKEISRILALRESLFILKEDGVYRLTGINGVYTVDLFDESTKIVAPDSAVVVNNQIYCLSNQGIVVISDTGVEIISYNLDNVFQQLISANYNFRFTSFGITYETDRAYWLFVPTTPNDDVATQAFRYGSNTNTWTRHTLGKTCGIVNSGDDKMYLGPNDQNFIERERKQFNRTDYADRQFELQLQQNAVLENQILLSQPNIGEAGDALVQTQYLTIKQYNQLLSKLDLDPGIGGPEETLYDFSGYTGSIPNDLHTKYFILYSASDARKYAIVLDAIGDLEPLSPLLFSDLADAQQIIIDISAINTLADLTNLIQNRLKSTTLDFVVTYVNGQEVFTTRTVRNGDTTDSSDSLINGLNDGFVVTTLSQGFGDYYDNNFAEAGDNLVTKLDNLAIQLDNDPSVVQNDFVSAIGNYSAIGSTITAGNPTIITQVNHGLQDGRLVDITNSTPNIDGSYIITKIDNDNFSIDIETLVNGTCDWEANVTTFKEVQAAFNTIVIKLNNDDGTYFSNYLQSDGSVEFETLIVSSVFNSGLVTPQFILNFIQGPITVYKGIINNIVYAPETFGDPSVMKQVREGTVMFENANFSTAEVGYRTDLSPGFEFIPFNKNGKGDWGTFVWSNQNWGGGFSGVPFRTYIPLSKMKCRFIQASFVHNSAREKWAIFGISYTLRGISERAYRS